MFIVLSGVTFRYFRFLVCSLSVLCLRNLFVDSRGWKLHETRSRHKEADGCEWASWWSLSAAPESSPECWTLLEQVVISSSWIRVDWQFIFFLEGWRHHGSEYWNHELVKYLKIWLPSSQTPLAIPSKVGLKEELVILFNAHLVNKEHLYSIDWNLRHCEALDAIDWSSGATRIQGLYSWCHCVMDPWQPQKPIPWIPWMTGTWVQERVPKWIGQCFSMTLPKLPATASVALSYTCRDWTDWTDWTNSNMQNMQSLPALDLVWGLALKFPLSFVDLPACAQLSVCGLKT